VNTPHVASLLLGSADPTQLRSWYVDVLGGSVDPDRFVHFGAVAILIDGRDDVASRAAEPGRVILNFHVADIAATGRRLDENGVRWISPIEYRKDGGAWFGTVEDPDGNYVQLIQLTHAYWSQRRARHAGSPLARAGLTDATVAARLPAQDLERARTFYAERLGLEPVDVRSGGLLYECGGHQFALFASTGRPSGEHTQLGFHVADIETTVHELRERGLVFDEVQMEGLPSRDGIVDVPGTTRPAERSASARSGSTTARAPCSDCPNW
jgi:predicted enzyme related to lactoylglutathione lyase